MVRRVALVLAPLGGCALALGLDAPSFDRVDAIEAGATDAPAESAPDAPAAGTPEKLSDGNGQVLYLVLDDASVYFTSFDRWSLGRVPKSGGAVTYLYPPDGGLREPTGGLAVDEGYVYVPAYASAGGAGARRTPKDGGAAETIDACNTAFAIAIDETSVFWTTAACGTPLVRVRKLAKAAIDGGIVSESPPDPATKYAYATYGYLALDATTVYWVNASELHAIDKSLAAATARTIYTATAGDVARGIAVDDRVYAVFGTTLFAFDKASGAASTVATGLATGGRVGVATDAAHVYFTNPDGRVLRVAKSGGAPETLADGQAQPTGLAVDATHVYWSNANDGSIWRVGL